MRSRKNGPGNRVVHHLQSCLRRLWCSCLCKQRILSNFQASDQPTETAGSRIKPEHIRYVLAVERQGYLIRARSSEGFNLDKRIAATHEVGARRQRSYLQASRRLREQVAAATAD